jgi:D-glycero-alpha-D-manno-heptose-7-phosphate kinase
MPGDGDVLRARARAPLRLGLAGGGTDLSPYCDEYGGAVLNATIDRYAYAFIEQSTDGQVHFVAPDIEIEEVLPPDIDALSEAKLKLHAGVTRRIARQFANNSVPGLRITSFVDAPAGSGLGSSSALVVALVEAFATWLALPLGPYDVAHLAFEIERIDLGLAGGRQDQYAATFGGINFVEFLAGDRVIVNPLRVSPAVLNELETSLVACFSGVSRRSEAIVKEQQHRMFAAVPAAIESLHQLKRDAVEMKEALLRGHIPQMADILNRSWEAKKQTASDVTTSRIEELMGLALASGARGGKVSGAGGGGYLMFIVPPEQRVRVIHALNEAGGTANSVHLTDRGAVGWFG